MSGSTPPCRTHDSCPIIQIPESEIHTAFLRLYYNLKHHGDQLLPPFLADLQMIRSHHLLWSVDVIELNNQIRRGLVPVFALRRKIRAFAASNVSTLMMGGLLSAT